MGLSLQMKDQKGLGEMDEEPNDLDELLQPVQVIPLVDELLQPVPPTFLTVLVSAWPFRPEPDREVFGQDQSQPRLHAQLQEQGCRSFALALEKPQRQHLRGRPNHRGRDVCVLVLFL